MEYTVDMWFMFIALFPNNFLRFPIFSMLYEKECVVFTKIKCGPEEITHLNDWSVGLGVSSGDTVDGLARLTLVINSCLCLGLCWGCGILLSWLRLHSHSLLSVGVPESGVALLALYLGGSLCGDREDSYTPVLGCYICRRILLLLRGPSCDAGGCDVVRQT